MLNYDKDNKYRKRATIYKKNSLIVEQKLSFFFPNSNLVREVTNVSTNLKRVAWQLFPFLIILIRISRSILFENFSQFQEVKDSNDFKED